MRFYHFRKAHKKNAITLAVEQLDGVWVAGIATCSTKDQFSRRLGRLIAENRLQMNKKYPPRSVWGKLVLDSEPQTPYQVAKLVLSLLPIKDTELGKGTTRLSLATDNFKVQIISAF